MKKIQSKIDDEMFKELERQRVKYGHKSMYKFIKHIVSVFIKMDRIINNKGDGHEILEMFLDLESEQSSELKVKGGRFLRP